MLSNNNIISDDGTSVTFNYIDIDIETGKTKKRKLSGENFIALLMQHALPKGFRRTRDFGFLHGNANKRLRLIQYLLQVILPKFKPPEKPCFTCKTCQHPLSITGFIRPKPVPG